MKKMNFLLVLFIPLISCQQHLENQAEPNTLVTQQNEHLPINKDSLAIVDFYTKHSKITVQSESVGTVSQGKLVNGKIMPYWGPNFSYFDKDSYLASRAFTSDVVKTIVLDTYNRLFELFPDRYFYLMELSNHDGGKIYPHRTHQNGLSVDFMMPKLKDGIPNYQLDTLGKQHYFLEFNNQGEYVQDPTIKIDFNLIAKHILLLNEEAKKHSYSIEKVIIKIEYKDELFATPYGKELKNSGIYVVNNLSKMVNDIHDDHFHIDFKRNSSNRQ